MKKEIMFLPIFLLFLSWCSINITTTQETDNENKQFLDITMKQECAKTQSDRELYFINSSFYEEHEFSDCKMDMFYSSSKNTCIWAYICKSNWQPVYWISDYFLKKNIFYCKWHRIAKEWLKNVKEFETLFNWKWNVLVHMYSIDDKIYDGEFYPLPIGVWDLTWDIIPYFKFYDTYEVQNAPDICLILWSSEREKLSK